MTSTPSPSPQATSPRPSRTRQLARWLGRMALVELLVIPLWACDPFHTGFDDEESAKTYRATQLIEPEATPASLKVMTWNVKFGGGRIDFFFDCHDNRVHMTEAEVKSNLDALSAAILEQDPDIILMQEVDAMSKRGAYIDQVRYILERTRLNYGAYASQWKADYVPSNGIGQVDSGNAILSKYPITKATRIALPLIGEQDGLTQYFYLRRNMLHVEVKLPQRDRALHVVNVHTSAFSNDGTKKKQIDLFKAKLDELDAAGEVFIAGGDLNALPPGTEESKLSGFPDSACEADSDFDADTYAKETDWLQPLYDAYKTAIPLDDYKADNDRHMTHVTSEKFFWNRKLDYLFTNATMTDGDTIQSADKGGMDTLMISDHAPIRATLLLEVGQ